MDKFDIKVNYKTDFTSFKISKSSTINKLIQFIEISFEELKITNYALLHDQTNLKLLPSEVILEAIFTNSLQEISHPQANPSLSSASQIELTILIDKEDNNIYTVDCSFEGKVSSFKISANLTFQKFKFNILTCFPVLEQENYQIIYQTNDITNYYSNDKQLKDIFTNVGSSTINKIILLTQPKTIIEYHKRCSFCHIKKGMNICRKCSLVNCEDCSGQDIHNDTRNVNYVPLSVFKEFEQKTLEDLLNQLNRNKNENDQVNSNHFIQLTKEKLSLINKKYEEMYKLLQSIKDTQLNNLSNLIDSIINKYLPEKLSQLISDLYETILKYKLNPFYDCEESMRKIIEFENLITKFCEDFSAYLLALNYFNDKYEKCTLINKKINEMLQMSLTETQLVFKEKTEVKHNYNVIMKVYDCSSVLVYDNDKEDFYLMNFHDENNKFRDNFNNFIQLNYKGEKLFIVTGTPCQQFFCYDLQFNQMQFISTLKYSHNWWPSLICIDEPQQGIDIFCLTGSYTVKCEMLLFNTKQKVHSLDKTKKIEEEKKETVKEKQVKDKEIGEGEAEANEKKEEAFDQYDSLEKPEQNQNEDQEQQQQQINEEKKQNNIELNSPSILSKIFEWIEIADTSGFHGQGASFILNNETIYLFFGYDYNHSPIGLIERLNITNISSILLSGGQSLLWETIKFNNPDNISSFLYYNAVMKLNDDKILVLGGLKEINEIDVVYCYEPKTNSLLKTEKKIQFKEVQFSNEKLCFKLTKDEISFSNNSIENEYALIDGKNSIHIFKEKSLIHKMLSFSPAF